MSATAKGTQGIKAAVTRQERLSVGPPRLSPRADWALRLIAGVLRIGGVVIGLGKPIGVVLFNSVVVALLLFTIDQRLKRCHADPSSEPGSARPGDAVRVRTDGSAVEAYRR